VVFERSGGCPSVRPARAAGRGGPVLVNTAGNPGDLLSWYCHRGALNQGDLREGVPLLVTHAHGPVLIVPLLTRPGLGRGLHTWMFWHAPLSGSQSPKDGAG